MKASTESALDVGDKANDAVRVDGEQLRARVVGEGGNLGLTQRGRVEYALTGGRVNTDAIDNSAGVDTSDHEVNIKIALNRVVDDGRAGRRGPGRAAGRDDRRGRRRRPQRQPRAERDAGRRGRPRPAACSTPTSGSSARWSGPGRLVRSVEALPDDRALAERRRDGQALTGPELSVLLAYAKLEAGDVVLQSGLPDDPALEDLLIGYFPAPLRERFPAAITGHPLRREIVATALTNRAVNIAGVTGLFRLVAGDRRAAGAGGAGARGRPGGLRRRPAVGRRPAAGQPGVGDHPGRAAHRGDPAGRADRPLAAAAAGARRRAGAADRRRAGPVRRARRRGPGRAARLAAGQRGRRRTPSARRGCRRPGCPPELAAEVAAAPLLPAALDLAVVTERTGAPVALAGQVMQCLAERLGLVPLRELVIALPRDRRWPSMARASLRDDLADGAGVAHRGRAEPCARPTTDAPDELVGAWVEGLGRHAGRARPRSWPTSRRGTGTSWPSCWSPSARCAACASAARPAASPAPRA